MLKVTLDVHSGTQKIVMPDKVKGSYIEKFNLNFNPDNRPLFLRGILLFLMGERISLHVVNQDAGDDEVWVKQKQGLCAFLDKLELKGCLRPQASNYNLITFEQHRKHGVPMYAMQQFEGNTLIPITESRLNKRYAEFIDNGLFDVFRLMPCAVKPIYNGSKLANIITQPVNTDVLFKSGNWPLHKNTLMDLLSTILSDCNYFIEDKVLTSQATDVMLATLNQIFTPVSTEHVALRPDGNSYNHIMEHIKGAQNTIYLFKVKQLGYGLDESTRTPEQQQWIHSMDESSSRTAAVFAYFMWQYLSMYQQLYLQEEGSIRENTMKLIGKKETLFNKKIANFKKKAEIEKRYLNNNEEHQKLMLEQKLKKDIEKIKEKMCQDLKKSPDCTAFGLDCLNLKSKKGLQALAHWLQNPKKAFNDKPKSNSCSDYYKGVFDASKYGVSTRSPVLTQRYDGVFELYIKSDVETEQLIMDKIKHSGRHYLRVGKLCLAELTQLPARIPSRYWETVEDDEVKKG
ncbi:hypothetical protein [Photobacterium iliopiscarium]|uniref:Uncharacterized protein n=1 Tax=Photobacterium iliopiscarium TaxID=56192 RepID=A0A2T3MF89_9GAMM|nr:hypothetical protein [Photobacterium iliopiscarium]PSV92463.1 hypothetical protein C9I88_16575 [Photobacterium iliopiscarium]